MKRGASVGVSPFLIHRHDDVYPNPYTFDHTRKQRGEGKGMCDYVPFGAGLHKCLGIRLAEVEVVIALADLLTRYTVQLANCTPDAALDYDGMNWLTTGFPKPSASATIVRVTPRV